MNGILWEYGVAKRSGASTALVVRTEVRESQCRHLKNLFNSFPATCVAETKAQLALRTPYGHSSRFTSIYLFLRSFLLLLSHAVTDKLYSSFG